METGSLVRNSIWEDAEKEQLIKFLQSDAFLSLLYAYVIERGLDVAIKIPNHIYNLSKQNIPLANMMMECMQKSRNDARDILHWKKESDALVKGRDRCVI